MIKPQNRRNGLLGSLLFGLASMASAQTLLNVSYDVSREFYKDVNAVFVANYKKTKGLDIKVDQSHGGSSAQARAVNDGLEADVVTMNTTSDVDAAHHCGLGNRWPRHHCFQRRRHHPYPCA
jgi:sulfate transport system substrate-binding protein